MMMRMMAAFDSILILFPLMVLLLPVIRADYSPFINVNDPVVATQYGSIRGSRYVPTHSLTGTGPVNGITYVQFIGVPYGAPPTGVNRFRPPRLPNEWSQVLDCTGTNRVMCPQVYQRFRTTAGTTSIREDEDCLHLNIYVPVLSNQLAPLPVLVYIHGGEFKYGGKDFYKPDYLLQAGGNVNAQFSFIVVTINYRLGVLGFLSTDDYNAPGNNGIRDQALALQWISTNIGKFNGNPRNVTIMGHDAGAVSVSFHLLNPEVNDYFTRAIAVSGSIFSPWALRDNPLAQARDFAYRFNCGYRPDQIVECLRYQDLGQLMATSAERDWDQNLQPFWFRPVVDRNVTSALLRDFPLNLYESGQFNRKPYVVITTGREGSLEYYLQAGRIRTNIDLERQIAFLIRPYLKYYTSELMVAAAFEYKYFNRTKRALTIPLNTNLLGPNGNPGLLGSQYTLNNHVNQGGYSPFASGQGGSVVGYTELELGQLFCEMLGDFLYTGPMDYAARLHSAQATTMMAVFDYVGHKSFGPLQNDVIKQVSLDTYGATHFNDLFYALPNEYDPSGLQTLDTRVAMSYTRFLAEFILFGVTQQSSYVLYTAAAPSYQKLTLNGQWQPYSATASNGYRTEYVDFINNYIYPLQDRAVLYPPHFPQQEYHSYQQATWTLTGLTIFLLLIIIILIVVLVVRHRQQQRRDQDDSDGNENEPNVALKRRYHHPGTE